jgi:hypothetical protein
VRVWRITLLLIGCGRIGFDVPSDAAAVDGAAADGAPPSIAEGLACGVQKLLDGGGHMPHDVLAWVNDAQGDWLVGVEHITQNEHMIERHAITGAASAPVAGAAEVILAVDHVDVLSFEPVGDRYVLGYNEFNLQTGQTLLLTPAMVELGRHPLGMLASGNPPLARAGGGGLAMIGLVSGELKVMGIDDTGAPTAQTNFLATPAEGAGLPTMVALDDGLAVVWHSDVRGTCRLAKLSASLDIAAGPVDIAIAGCSDAHVAWLPSARRIVVVADSSTGGVAAAAFDENLAPISPPAAIATSGHWARIVADGDGAWVAWAESGSVEKLRHARMGPDARIGAPRAAVGELDSSLGHYHTLQRVGSAVIALWTDATQARTFSAMRLCL